MKVDNFWDYANDLRYLRKLCDVKIHVNGDGGKERIVQLHKLVLAYHSRYFRDELDAGRIRKEYTFPDVSASGLDILIGYMYGQFSYADVMADVMATDAASFLQVHPGLSEGDCPGYGDSVAKNWDPPNDDLSEDKVCDMAVSEVVKNEYFETDQTGVDGRTRESPQGVFSLLKSKSSKTEINHDIVNITMTSSDAAIDQVLGTSKIGLQDSSQQHRTGTDVESFAKGSQNTSAHSRRKSETELKNAEHVETRPEATNSVSDCDSESEGEANISRDPSRLAFGSGRGKSKVCTICGKLLLFGPGMKRHMATHSDKRPHVCSECGKGFRLREGLRKHQQSHNPQRKKLHACDVCGRSFHVETALRKHVLMVHKPAEAVKCEQCGLFFKHKRYLERHIQVIHSGRLYKCDNCDKSFACMAYLDRHKLVHSDDMPFQCDQCDQQFRCKETLNTHVSTSHSHEEFQCEVCGTIMKTAGALKRHKKQSHSGEQSKPRELSACNVCGKHVKKLSQHMLSHKAEETPTAHVCDVCQKSFSQKRYLRQHMFTHKEKRFGCVKCGKSFSFRHSYQCHLITCLNNTPETTTEETTTKESVLVVMAEADELDNVVTLENAPIGEATPGHVVTEEVENNIALSETVESLPDAVSYPRNYLY